MIKKIPYSYFSLKSLASFADQVISIVEKSHAEELMLAGMVQAIRESREKAIQAINSTLKEDLTEQVIQLDAQRDDSFVSLRNHIDAGLLRHRHPEYQEACKRLSVIFLKNGRMLNKLGYQEQSAALSSLFMDLSDASAMEDLKNIHALEWLEELKKDQEEFLIVYTQRGEEKAGKDIPRDEDAFKELKTAMDNLFILLNAFQISKQVSGLDATIDTINESIDRTLASMR